MNLSTAFSRTIKSADIKTKSQMKKLALAQIDEKVLTEEQIYIEKINTKNKKDANQLLEAEIIRQEAIERGNEKAEYMRNKQIKRLE